MPNLLDRARKFLAGEHLTFNDANQLWEGLRDSDELPLARAVLARLRSGDGKHLLDKIPADAKLRNKLCQQHAMLTSKDQELGATVRHDQALEILSDRFDLSSSALDGDAETLGIAGGIHKRRWEDLGQYEDLRKAAEYYRRGAIGDAVLDGYAQVNAAFLQDLLAATGDDPDQRKEQAARLRNLVVEGISDESQDWWAAASRAESLLGLGRYAEAIETIRKAPKPPAWKLQSTTRQMARVAGLREKNPRQVPEIAAMFDALLPGAGTAVASAFIGKVGLALSGGGFRASFYHLGVLARLAELDVLRHVEVLSCVSGGSIVGACYWLGLRRKFLERPSITSKDYVDLVNELISHFKEAVSLDVRRGIQPSKAAIAFRVLLKDQQGALDPEKTAAALEEHFYRPLCPDLAQQSSIFMDQLSFKPRDHDATLAGSADFNPGKHNWLRANKVPALVINATTVNTGRGWQFTPTWMGESPWALNEGADNIERLQWAWYDPQRWRIRLARAVAASASVPGVFAPLELGPSYEGVRVQLVDGGVFDNQGVMSLLAMNCNVLLVSDAAGQLLLQREPTAGLKGLGAYASRAMDILMERVRTGTYGDLYARHMSGLVRGLMFLHMKAGLDADTIRLPFTQDSYETERSPLSPSGVRKEYQKALAELRTDLDAFSEIESSALMACGYQMASKSFERDLASKIPELSQQEIVGNWPFAAMLTEITSSSPAAEVTLDALRKGSQVTLN